MLIESIMEEERKHFFDSETKTVKDVSSAIIIKFLVCNIFFMYLIEFEVDHCYILSSWINIFFENKGFSFLSFAAAANDLNKDQS